MASSVPVKLKWSGDEELEKEIKEHLDEVLEKFKEAKTFKGGKFWTKQSTEISKKLWKPSAMESISSTSILSKKLSDEAPMGSSWFSIKKKSVEHKVEKLDIKNINSINKLKKEKKLEENNYKTVKFRLHPTPAQKKELDLILRQSRWSYNAAVNVFRKMYTYEESLKLKSLSFMTFEREMRKYKYVEDKENKTKGFVKVEGRNQTIKPYWWKFKTTIKTDILDKEDIAYLNKQKENGKGDEREELNRRTPRGAFRKFVSSLNSSLSNYHNGNITHFKMKYRTKKDSTEFAHYEDDGFPKFLKEIKSVLWYRNDKGKRATFSFSELNHTKGLELIHDTVKDKYYLHCPVERSWYPEDDKRKENQTTFTEQDTKIISLDPGIRKFMVGYDPDGSSIFIGKGACRRLTKLLLKVDKNPSNLLWRKIKNLVNELHWKTISFLVSNYDVILLPDFRVSEMLRKGNLSKIVKRLMTMFSFHSFKQKLIYKCEANNKKLYIVDESYTSCTCTLCGTEKSGLKGSEKYECSKCNESFDRDIGGSRNILIKNITI